MKKFTATVVLLFVLSVSAFADGEIPLGGKNCPQGQTCLTGEIPLGGRAETSDSTETTIYTEIFDFITSIFG